jgi:8-oxo-dGTP pyrophosphatase MutT (NUDIX family)
VQEKTKQLFKEIIENQLPGEDAHLMMLPKGRQLSSISRKEAVDPKQASVAVHLFITKLEEPYLILIKRSVYDGAHSGQIAFPGGKLDEKDKNLIQTALRESHEEIGLSTDESQLIGALSPVYIPISNFNVQPFLFLHFNSLALLAEDREVAEILTVPLSEIIEDKNIHKKEITLMDTNESIEVTGFLLHENWVWGASALILNEVKEVLKIYYREAK